MENQIDSAVQELVAVNDNMLALQNQIIEATRSFQQELSEYQKQDRELRDAIVKAMTDSGTKSYEDDYIKLVNVAPTTRKGVDAAKLKLLHPEVYAEVEKITNVKGSVRITLK